MTGNALISIADRSLKNPIPVEHTCSHAVLHLFGVFLALMLADTSEKVLDQLAIRIFAELDGRALQFAACNADRRSQLNMGFKPARKAADIVDEHSRIEGMVFSQKLQHGLHAGTVDQTAGDALVSEGFNDFIVPVAGELTASRFLRAQTVTFLHLLRTGNPAINYSNLGVVGAHEF